MRNSLLRFAPLVVQEVGLAAFFPPLDQLCEKLVIVIAGSSQIWRGAEQEWGGWVLECHVIAMTNVDLEMSCHNVRSVYRLIKCRSCFPDHHTFHVTGAINYVRDGRLGLLTK